MLHVGLDCSGCGSADAVRLESAIEQACRQNHLAMGAIATLATDTEHPALRALSAKKTWPLRCFTGLPSNTTEAAALAAAREHAGLDSLEPPRIRVRHRWMQTAAEEQLGVAIAQSS